MSEAQPWSNDRYDAHQWFSASGVERIGATSPTRFNAPEIVRLISPGTDVLASALNSTAESGRAFGNRTSSRNFRIRCGSGPTGCGGPQRARRAGTPTAHAGCPEAPEGNAHARQCRARRRLGEFGSNGKVA